jgi:hypothetical protein
VPAAEWAPKSPKKSTAFPRTSVMLIFNGVAVSSDANDDDANDVVDVTLTGSEADKTIIDVGE